MNVFIIEYKAKGDNVDQVLSAAKEFVAGIAADNDTEVRYRSFRRNDGLSFVHIGEFASEEALKRFQGTNHFKKFSGMLPDLCEVKPAAQQLELVADSRA